MATEFQLNNSFAFWVNRLNSAMQDDLAKRLKSYDLSAPQWAVMNVIAHGLADTPAEIARHVGADRSAITRLVDRLEKKEYVKRVNDRVDRRSVKIFLSDVGLSIMDKIDQIAQEHQQHFLSALHRSEQRALRMELQKMLKQLDVDGVEHWQRAL